MNKINKYFTRFEKGLWAGSVLTIILSTILIPGVTSLSLIASLIGVTSLILNAKGNPLGQFLMVIFSLLYGIISYQTAYYGEMLTYIGMTGPMALVALISWIKNPFKGNRAQVEIASLNKRDMTMMIVQTIIVTIIFYFILKYFNTANLGLSTLSVTTSFIAVYLTYKRSPVFALAYAANDIVLIFLWTLAMIEDPSYISVLICFVIFFINDMYGYLSWQKMKEAQRVE